MSWSLGSGPARPWPDHHADNRAWIRAALGGDAEQEATPDEKDRYRFELARPEDPDVLPLEHRILRAVSERIRWRAQVRAVSATVPTLHAAGSRHEEEPNLRRGVDRHLELGAIKPQTIRSWRGKLLAGGTTEPQAVKSYSLLRAILNTAVREDEILKQNPCRIPGYDRYHTPERPVATVAQVLALAEQMLSRYVALITVAVFSGLRWGELVALRRCDVDVAAGTVRVPRKLAALKSGLEFGPPTSAAGIRVVALPAVARRALTEHLGEFTGMNSEALVFTGDKDMPLRTGNFRRAVRWAKALADSGGIPFS